MGTKAKPSKFDCYSKLDADEPHFVLMGRDPSAADLVLEWAYRRLKLIEQGLKPESDRAMVHEAFQCADDMMQFAAKRQAEKAKAP